MKKNREGLRYPAIDDLLEKIDSKYKLVYAAGKVAHIIDREELEVEDATSSKTIGVALEEILHDKVHIKF
ncbi:MAG TPA: DNA-directed RNA polymerase subunit omega [Acholeplasmataceae bacterium]|nr:DNA-directed RNA polymerase subunit omega [Acholeplasmataceae bacterium]